MFESIEWIAELKYNKKYNYRYALVDSDFTETLYTGEEDHIYDKIIQLYESKKLNASANLALYLKFRANQGMDMDFSMGFYSTSKSKLWQQYKNEVEKYLLLI